MRQPPTWSEAAASPVLAEGETHVWRASLDRALGVRRRLVDVLCAEEHARAARILPENGRDRWIVGRAVLRAILARYLAVRPGDLRLGAEPGGRPVLAGADLELHFSLAHSGPLALVAVTAVGRIGVDVEKFRETDHERVARRLFSAEEQDALEARPEPARREAFFWCWARKEAYTKAVGQGLFLPLSSFTVSEPGDDGSAKVSRKGRALERWSVWDVQAGPGYAGAIAVQGGASAVRCFDLTPGEGRLIRGPFPSATAA